MAKYIYIITGIAEAPEHLNTSVLIEPIVENDIDSAIKTVIEWRDLFKDDYPNLVDDSYKETQVYIDEFVCDTKSRVDEEPEGEWDTDYIYLGEDTRIFVQIKLSKREIED